jgi:hypothetical protein
MWELESVKEEKEGDEDGKRFTTRSSIEGWWELEPVEDEEEDDGVTFGVEAAEGWWDLVRWNSYS